MHHMAPAVYAEQVKVIQRLRYCPNSRIRRWVLCALDHPEEMIPWYWKALQVLDLAKARQKSWTWGQICGVEPLRPGQTPPPPRQPDIRPTDCIGWYEVTGIQPFSGKELQPWVGHPDAKLPAMKPFVDFLKTSPPHSKVYYTDGSSTPGTAETVRAGAAVLCPEEGRALIARVSSPQTAGRGEVFAGLKASLVSAEVEDVQDENQRMICIGTDYEYLERAFRSRSQITFARGSTGRPP